MSGCPAPGVAGDREKRRLGMIERTTPGSSGRALVVREAVAPPPKSAGAGIHDFGASLTSLFFRSPLYRRFVLDGPVPGEVLRSFPWHAPGDRTQAEAILGLQFVFFGKRLPFGGMPWSVMPAGRRLARTLHGFAWLADLKAVGSEEARRRARALVLSWISANRRWSPIAWSAPVLGQRLASWLATGDFVLENSLGDEQARFLESAGRQARHLARVNARSAGTAAAFPALAGELAAALCLKAVPLAPVVDRLLGEIARQVLADGGQRQRNPASQIEVFRHLLDCRAALADAEQAVPAELIVAIERMAPAVRALRYGDGRLAVFHGAKEGDRTLIDALLAASRIGASARASLPEMRFERLVAGRTLLLADVGPPPAGGHAAPLAIEMSHGPERIVVNCGAFGGDDPRWRAALRSTAAHSTLSVEETSVGDTGWLGRQPIRVTSSRQETEGSVWLEASHDGYRSRFGVIHQRRLFLGESGLDVRGEDALDGRSGRRFHLRFHLHPDIQAKLADDGTSVLMRTARGIGWRFLAVGGILALEESTYLGTSDQPRRCQQIVVAGSTQKGAARIKWAFRHDGTP